MTQTTSSSDTKIVPVHLGDRSYDIHVGTGVLSRAGEIITPLLNRPTTLIVTDENVANLHLSTLQSSLDAAGISHDTITLPAGESTKNYTHLEDVLERMLSAGIERNDMVIAFGGGVIGDLTGFAASILRRGVDFIQIPTTLLAQVDSSVGGKTAINSRQGKNLVGTFHQPRLVLADVGVLSTLPERELRAGYAEVLKYGLLGDAAFFAWLEDNGAQLLAGNASAQIYAVEQSCKAKAVIVAADEREAGKRALLNLGHTFGHALEAETGYSQRLLHGEGVSIGMVLAFQMSESLGFSSKADTERLLSHMKTVGMPASVNDIADFSVKADDLLAHMMQDKKVVDGTVTLILARGIGDAFITREISHDQLHDFLNRMVQR